MKLTALLSIMTFLISTLTLANEEMSDIDIDYQLSSSIIKTEIGVESTCMDEYLTRDQQLRKFLFWAPPITVVAAPAGFMIGGYATAGASSLLGISGWSALGNTIAGAALGGVGVIGTFITLETIKAIELGKNRFIMRVVTAIKSEDYQNKKLVKFLKKYRKKYPQDSNLSDSEIRSIVADLDYNGALCNGEVTGKDSTKLRKLLAKRKSLQRYIHENFGQ